jgi:O-antigen ligase
MMIFLLVLLVPSLGVRGRRGYVLLAAASAVAAAVTGLVLFSDINVDILLRMLGRDATLTGRTAVWSAVVDMIREHPWFGWGHGAFWRDWGGAGSNYVLRRAGWNPGYAHNGFLDQGVELGVVGVAALFVALANTGLKAFVWARRAPATWLRLWPLGFIVFAVIANLTEGGLVQQNNYMWLLFVTVSTSLGRDPAAGWIAKAQERLLPPIPSAGERWPTVPPSLRPLHWGWRRGA